jgi:hypothetical protein
MRYRCLIVLSCVLVLSAAVAPAAEVDPFMGDWQGDWEVADAGQSGSLAAQVIALGGGQYRLRLLESFTMVTEPYAVLDGRLQDGTVKFAGKLNPESTTVTGNVELIFEKDKGAGHFQGEASGQDVKGLLSLKKTVRESPTLGAKPPAGAVVLFDGTNFEKWFSLGGPKGTINITEAVGNAQNAVAYLKAKIWSPKGQPATLLLGSDDGVKVWLNGKLVHSNNASRGVSPDQDKITVTLKEGTNELLLKVTNGAGDWGAAVRFAGPDGKSLESINEVSPQFKTDKGSNEYLRSNSGFLTQWRVAGPFQEGGKGPEALFDTAFAPEKNPASEAGWKWINANTPNDKTVKWRLVDGAMEVKPGSGSIVTKDKFKDFKLHVEFRTPFMPEARGQGRGNSGVYLQGRYEVQVLDSYGLEPKDNECGGIYQVGTPAVNMCLPPMQWQTYDVTFQAPRFNGANKEKDAVITVVHNGVVIHDQLAIPHPTGGALDDRIAEPGPIYLQDHGNLVQFRNIWLIEPK